MGTPFVTNAGLWKVKLKSQVSVMSVIDWERTGCNICVLLSEFSQIDTPVNPAPISRNRVRYTLKFLWIFFWIVCQ